MLGISNFMNFGIDIITSMAEAGFHINRLIEEKRYEDIKEIPRNFTIAATKF